MGDSQTRRGGWGSGGRVLVGVGWEYLYLQDLCADQVVCCDLWYVGYEYMSVYECRPTHTHTHTHTHYSCHQIWLYNRNNFNVLMSLSSNQNIYVTHREMSVLCFCYDAHLIYHWKRMWFCAICFTVSTCFKSLCVYRKFMYCSKMFKT